MSKKARRRDLYAQLDALYAQLPRVACQGRCSSGCAEILLAAGEAERLRQADPQRRAIRTINRHCIYLTPHGRCSLYAVRPLVCRVAGVVQRMSCPYGCVPDRWLSDHEFVRIGAAIERLAGALCESTADGLVRAPRGYQELAEHIAAPGAMPPEAVEHYATLTRGARALHGGFINGLVPERDPSKPAWISLDSLRRK